jgi:hypothetical protein
VATALRVGTALEQHGIHGVLTGGACASLYTGGRYHSADVDIVLSGTVVRQNLDAAMASVGFKPRRDHYACPGIPFFVEFPLGPLAIGLDHDIRPVVFRRGRRWMHVLSATDSCRDRLAAFYHWNDRQALAVAVTIAIANRVRMSAIRAWSTGENQPGRWEEFLHELERARARRPRIAPRGATS